MAVWHCREKEIEYGSKVLLMGIVNVTPDSFSDGGDWLDPATALTHARALEAQGAGNVIVICGGVIPQQDYEFLQKAGVKAIFGPGTNIPSAAQDILALIRQARA